MLGQDPTRLPAGTRARIGFMPQHVSLYDDLTVTENLDFVASLYGLFMFRRRRRIGALLDWLELGDARKRRAGDLSGGMRRRLQLACALVHDPELVFLDEPTAGIDPLVRQSIWRELHRLREAGRTLLITTQYVPEAEECDAVALIAEGRLIAFASPEELRRRAFGGQLLEVETSDPVDADRLQADVAVEEVRRIGPRRVQVLSQDAATATPAVIAGVEAQGSTVTSIHEARPSFDEVFALLVRGSEPEETGAPAEASSDEPAAHEAALAPLPPADGAGDDRDLPPADDDDERRLSAAASRARPREPRAPARGGGAMSVMRRLLRIFAVAGKETVEILRRPMALVSVVAGPVLILGLFGLGYLGQPPLRAELVIPPDSGLASDPASYSSLASDRVTVVGVTPDVATARERLRAGEADIIVIAPADAEERLAQGEQAVLRVEYDTVSPYRAFIATTAADQLVAAVNGEVIATAAQRIADRGRGRRAEPAAGAQPRGRRRPDAGRGRRPRAEPAEHRRLLRDHGPRADRAAHRDHRERPVDAPRSPARHVRPVPHVADGELGPADRQVRGVRAARHGRRARGAGRPRVRLRGPVPGRPRRRRRRSVALLVLASIGIGIVVALVSDSDRQAVQVALLVLLASVFFSGLALDLDQFSAPVRAVSALLPVTQAGSLLQDLMLRGETAQAWRAAVLAAMAGVLFVAGWLVLRRQLHRPA